jgi:3-phosphoshikimate 1-carboxyvinyltransferase
LEELLDLHVRPGPALRGETTVPGDKSITHRALIAAALARGESVLRGFDPLDDALRTQECLAACGVAFASVGPRDVRVQGVGLQGLRSPAAALYCGASGTTMRLLAGLLAGQPLTATLDGEEALRRRPMARVTMPLRQMGARIAGREDGSLAPLTVTGGGLHGIDYTLPMASAQVKSALLLAALNAEGETVVREPAPTRDHTERLLRALGAPLTIEPGVIRCTRAAHWPGDVFELPGDVSAAAFLLVAATLVAGSEVLIRNVGVNPTRAGVLDVLGAMGGCVARRDERTVTGGEPCADLHVRHAGLRAVELGGALIPNLIDELPVLAVAATQAAGTTVIRDAAELRVKETDRIAALTQELNALGARVEARPDGMVIDGPSPLVGAHVAAHGDHRLVMALAVAALVARGETIIHGAEAVTKSYPGFVETMRSLGASIL